MCYGILSYGIIGGIISIIVALEALMLAWFDIIILFLN